MKQLESLWESLDNQKRVLLVLGVSGVFCVVYLLIRLAITPSMTLLYSGLEPNSAGEIVEALEQRGAVYEVKGQSIFVDSRMRDELRLTLATQGLPANSGQGYELLDNLSGFGTTAQMFDTAYWRAKEGELARTIMANPAISHARVHIANATSRPFSRNAQPTASIAITQKRGTLSQNQAQAIQHLVASAVVGLTIDHVTVIDSNGTLFSGQEDESKQMIQDSRADTLREKIMRLVEARVGQGNAVVEVSVDTITETESIRERHFDPESRVAISTDTEERTNASSQQAEGVTVASNLPDGDASEGEQSSAETSETRERINYEVSETEREVVKTAGAVRRITVAVLVNGTYVTDDAGATSFTQRGEDELRILRELVESAVGYDEARGDEVTIHSLEMATPEILGTSATSPLFALSDLDLTKVVQASLLFILAIILALFVLRPLLRSQKSTFDEPNLLPMPENLMADTDADISDIVPEIVSEGETFGNLNSHDWPVPQISSDNQVDRLRSMIGERQDDSIEILRNWLEEKEDAK